MALVVDASVAVKWLVVEDGSDAARDLDEYQLVVVDEAHNYRNPDAPTRAAALRRLVCFAPGSSSGFESSARAFGKTTPTTYSSPQMSWPKGSTSSSAGTSSTFDLPWNPMRLVQRHGRIDRIRTPP